VNRTSAFLSPCRIKPDIKIGIHSFLAWHSAWKGQCEELHNQAVDDGLTRRPQCHFHFTVSWSWPSMGVGGRAGGCGPSWIFKHGTNIVDRGLKKCYFAIFWTFCFLAPLEEANSAIFRYFLLILVFILLPPPPWKIFLRKITFCPLTFSWS